MTDKVQKIKDWISKEQDGLMDAQGNFEYPEHEGVYHILCNLDAYIDSLQEEPEPQFKVGDTIRNKQWDTAVHKITSIDDRSYCLDNGGKVDLSSQQLWELVEEPISGLDNGDMPIERWKQAVKAASNQKNYRSSKGLTETRDDYFVDGVQWADEHPKEKPVSEEWIDVAKQYVKEHVIGIDKVTFSIATDMFISGAKWQKEHLWKPADGDDLPEIDREVIALLDNGKVAFAHRPPEYWDGKDIVTGKVTRNYPKTYDKGGWNIPNVKWWLDCSLPNMEDLL